MNEKKMTLAEFANLINASDEWKLEFNEIIAANGWIDETGLERAICTDQDGNSLAFDEQGQAYILDWWEK